MSTPARRKATAAARKPIPAAVRTFRRRHWTGCRPILELRAGTTAVEIGAGTGKFTRLLAATGASVIAVDPVAAMLERLVLEICRRLRHCAARRKACPLASGTCRCGALRAGVSLVRNAGRARGNSPRAASRRRARPHLECPRSVGRLGREAHGNHGALRRRRTAVRQRRMAPRVSGARIRATAGEVVRALARGRAGTGDRRSRRSVSFIAALDRARARTCSRSGARLIAATPALAGADDGGVSVRTRAYWTGPRELRAARPADTATNLAAIRR